VVVAICGVLSARIRHGGVFGSVRGNRQGRRVLEFATEGCLAVVVAISGALGARIRHQMGLDRVCGDFRCGGCANSPRRGGRARAWRIPACSRARRRRATRFSSERADLRFGTHPGSPDGGARLGVAICRAAECWNSPRNGVCGDFRCGGCSNLPRKGCSVGCVPDGRGLVRDGSAGGGISAAGFGDAPGRRLGDRLGGRLGPGSPRWVWLTVREKGDRTGCRITQSGVGGVPFDRTGWCSGAAGRHGGDRPRW
jgi:hypothetical protein